MKILLLSNFSAGRCGIKNFGNQLSTALRLAGCEVTDWDIEYSHMYALIQEAKPAWLPADVLTYDVVLFNWHPITTNTFGPGHFFWPKGTKPLVAIYLNDIPPWSGCPAHDRADVLISAEPSPGCVVIPYPLCDWIPLADFPPPSPEFTVGWSGVRGDGAVVVREACERLGLGMNAPHEGWTTYEEEILRLARSTVNVCWYHEGRGISGGASQVASARRPLILNGSPMFAHLSGWEEEIYFGDDVEGIDATLAWVHDDWLAGEPLRCPDWVITEQGWAAGARAFIAAWEGVLHV